MKSKTGASARRPTMAGVLTTDANQKREFLEHDAIDKAVNEAGPVKLLTPKQAAESLSVTPRVLERWRATGEGPRYLKLSRATVRYTAADLTTFLAASARWKTTQR